jgi:tetratricopeptide (TPR) repeat protein
MLLPGRVLAFFWRNLLRGLRLLRERRFEESKAHTEAFLCELDQKPWLKNLIWLGFGTYSRSPTCFALNNLGAAEIGLGEMTGAREHLYAAMQADEACPLPYFNMGVLCTALSEHEEAQTWYEKAAALGYSRSVIDAIIGSSQTRLARQAGGSSLQASQD